MLAALSCFSAKLASTISVGCLLAASIVLAGLAAAATKRVRDATDEVAVKRRALKRAMRQASGYEEFAFAAEKLEALKRRTPVAAAVEAAREYKLYDARLLRDRLRHLRSAILTGVSNRLKKLDGRSLLTSNAP